MKKQILDVAVKAAKKAGEIIIKSREKLKEIEINEKAPHDYVTEVDKRAEQAIIETIHSVFPSHGIIAEESGTAAGDDFCWIIDPLDGTANFIHDFPFFAVSIGVRFKEELIAGVVYDPLRQEMFTASSGEGTYLNGEKIRVSNRKSLEGSLLGTGFPFKSLQKMEEYLAIFAGFLPYTSGIRRAGAAALDLANVAAGRLDGFWEFSLQPWDICAGVLLIREAGGVVTDFRGGSNMLNGGNIIAANSKLHSEMLCGIKKHF